MLKGRGWDASPYIGPDAQNYNILLPDGGSRTMTMEEFYNNVVTGQLAVAQQQNGKPVDTGRKYRVNLLVAYRFTEGWLKGFRTGEP